MIHVAKFIARHLFLTIFLALVALALLLSAARILTPRILASYANEIADIASQRLGQPVSIGDVSARWHGLGPVLELRNLTLWTPGRTATTLELDQVDVDFGLADMLASGYLAPGRITVTGAQLTIVRQSDGALRVRGVTTSGTGDASALLLLPARVHLLNGHVEWVDQLYQRPPLLLDKVDMIIRNDLTRHQLDADFTLDDSPFSLRADLSGDTTGHLTTWEGSAYLSAGQLSLARLLSPQIPEHYRMTDGIGHLELWADWSAGRLQRLTGRGSISDFALAGDHQSLLDIENLGALFEWQHTRRGWQLHLGDLVVKRKGRAWPIHDFSIEAQDPGATSEKFRIKTDYLDIGDLFDALSVRPPAQSLLADLMRAKPSGEIHHLSLEMRPRSRAGFSLDAELSNLAMSAWGRLPMLDNVSAKVHATGNGGRLRIDTTDGAIHPVRLLRWPISLQRVSGEMRWERRGAGWHIETAGLEADTPHLKTLSRAQMEVPDQGSPFIDLQIDFRDGIGAYAPFYYPASIMPPPLVTWLDSGILYGRVPSGSCLIRGPLADFPFHETHSGHFEVNFNVEDGIIDLPNDWPSIDDLDAEVRFYNNSLKITAESGRVLDSLIDKVEVSIDNLHPLSPLVVTGEVGGSLENALRVLQETPLKKEFAPLVEGIKATGDSRVKLAFELPLKQPEALSVDGVLSFEKAGLDSPGLGLAVEDLEGDLSFSHTGLKAEKLSARMDGQPIRAAITPVKTGTRIRLDARLDTASLKRRFPQLAAVPLNGTSAWRIDVLVPRLERMDSDALRVDFSSRLAGTAVDLPLGLGKAAAGERALKTSLALSRGTLDLLDLSFGDLVVEARRNAGLWSAKVDSPSLSGHVLIPPPGGKEPVKADLDRLVIDPGWLSPPATADTGSLMTPAQIPAVDLSVRNLLIGDADYGTLTARTRHSGNAIRLDALDMKSEDTTLTMTGGWSAKGKTQSTDMQVAIETKNLGRLLHDLSLSESVVDGSGKVEADLTWSGPPNHPQRDSLSGDIHFDAAEGRFEEVNPGVGRVLGLLNLTAVQRRLKLDFSDFFATGFVFDRFKGDFTIANGIARTDRTEIEAPSATIRLEGFTNLSTGMIDQDIYVAPALGSLMAIAGGLTGGPVLGAALFAAGRKIDKLATTHYRMTGPWEDTKVEPVTRPKSDEPEAPAPSGLPAIH